MDQQLIVSEENGDKKIVAYIISKNNKNLNIDEVRDFMKSKLPNYMIPSYFVELKSFPLMTNGKINRKKLPKLNMDRNNSESFIAPRTNMEEILSILWCDILNTQHISINDNFFDIGGHSLLAIQMITRLIGSKIYQCLFLLYLKHQLLKN